MFKNTYSDYWNYINFVVNHCIDEEDLREAIVHQKVLPTTTIYDNTTQHPCHLPDTALYLDALKQFKLIKENQHDNRSNR